MVIANKNYKTSLTIHKVQGMESHVDKVLWSFSQKFFHQLHLCLYSYHWQLIMYSKNKLGGGLSWTNCDKQILGENHFQCVDLMAFWKGWFACQYLRRIQVFCQKTSSFNNFFLYFLGFTRWCQSTRYTQRLPSKVR